MFLLALVINDFWSLKIFGPKIPIIQIPIAAFPIFGHKIFLNHFKKILITSENFNDQKVPICREREKGST